MSEIEDGDEFVLLSYPEAAAILTVSVKTTRAIVAGGDIPLVEVSERKHRVRLSDVKAYISRGGVRASV